MNTKKPMLLAACLCLLANVAFAAPKDDVSRLLADSKPATVKFYDGSSTWQKMTKAVSKLNNGKAIIVQASYLTLDTDGASKEVRACDPTSQAGTALGNPTDANAIPYFVLPGGKNTGGNTYVFKQLGLQKGDLAALISGDKLVFAIAADVGPEKQFGEGSVQLHRQLGHETVGKDPKNPKCAKDESLSKEVFIVVFPKSNNKWLPAKDIEEKGKKLWDELLISVPQTKP